MINIRVQNKILVRKCDFLRCKMIFCCVEKRASYLTCINTWTAYYNKFILSKLAGSKGVTSLECTIHFCVQRGLATYPVYWNFDCKEFTLPRTHVDINWHIIAYGVLAFYCYANLLVFPVLATQNKPSVFTRHSNNPTFIFLHFCPA